MPDIGPQDISGPFVTEEQVQEALRRIAAARNFGGTEAQTFPTPMLPAADLSTPIAPTLAAAPEVPEGTVTPPSLQAALLQIASQRPPTPKVGALELLQTGLGAFADIASNLDAARRGRTPTSNVLGALLTQQQALRDAERKHFLEQQKLDMDTIKVLSNLNVDQTHVRDQTMTGFLNTLKANPQMTEAEKMTLVDQTHRALLGSGIPSNRGTLAAMVRDPNLSAFVKDVWPFLTPKEFGVLEVTQRDNYRKGDVEAIRKNIGTFVNQKIATEAYVAARTLVPAVRDYVKTQHPDTQVGTMGFEDFLDLLQAQHPDKARAFEQFFRGTLPLMDDKVRESKDALLQSLGVAVPKIDLAAGERARLTEAEKTGAATPAALGAEQAREQALRGGKAATAGAVKAAEVRAAAQEPTGDVRDELRAQGVKDPVMATAADMRKAVDAVAARKPEQWSIKLAQEISARVKTGKPVDPDLTGLSMDDLREILMKEKMIDAFLRAALGGGGAAGGRLPSGVKVEQVK